MRGTICDRMVRRSLPPAVVHTPNALHAGFAQKSEARPWSRRGWLLVVFSLGSLVGCSQAGWVKTKPSTTPALALERVWNEAPAHDSRLPVSPASPPAHVSPAPTITTAPSPSATASNTKTLPPQAPSSVDVSAATQRTQKPTAAVPATANVSNPEPTAFANAELLAQLAPLKQQSPEEYQLVEQLLKNPEVTLPPLMQAQVVAWALYRQMQHRNPQDHPAPSPSSPPQLVSTAVQEKSTGAATAEVPTTAAASTPASPPLPAPDPAALPAPIPAATSPAPATVATPAGAADLQASSKTVPDMPPSADSSSANAETTPAIPPAVAASSAAPTASDEPEELARWDEHLARAIRLLEREIKEGKLEEADAIRAEAQLRLLYVLANQREAAVEPITRLDPSQQEFWKHQLHSLHIALDAEGRHAASRRAALSLRDLRQATDYLANLSTLDVRNLAFCSEVQSFGRYTEFPQYAFRPRQEVLLYVEVDNFASEEKNNRHETELRGTCDIYDARQQRVASMTLPNDQQVCNNRRRDYFIAYPILLPSDLEPGQYSLQLTMEDLKGHKSSQASLEFQIKK